MRAARLLQLMLLLQGRTPARARDLAARLQVCERTIHRDVEALSGAGVPVFAQRGPRGGVALLPGWRSDLTGLTSVEAEALAAIATPGALADLGLSAPLQSALVKLAASLPAVQRRTAEHARERLHIDPSSWFGSAEPTPHLAVLREAVWQDRRVALRYRDFDGRASRPVVDPYGLVIKVDRWYVVAGTPRGPAVFRGARVEAARLRPEAFERPRDFDLKRFWEDWCRRFQAERPRYEVKVAVTPAGEEALARNRPPADQDRLARARRRGGRKTVTIDFERRAIALAQVLPLGGSAEVLEPAELRAHLRELAKGLAEAYGGS